MLKQLTCCWEFNFYFSDLCKYRDIHKSINIIIKKISATNPSQNLIMYIRLETTISHKFSFKLCLDSPQYWRKIRLFLMHIQYIS